MATTLDQLHREIMGIKKAMLQIQRELRAHTSRDDDEAHLELADDVVEEIEASRRRNKSELIKHEAVMQRYGVR